MPPDLLQFCRKCLTIREVAAREKCNACNGDLLPLLDENGALSRDFLAARRSCCESGCRNCPYEKAGPTGEQPIACTPTKTCPRCRARFECGGGECWCANVQLNPATLAQLEQAYDGCLCPSCLAELSPA